MQLQGKILVLRRQAAGVLIRIVAQRTRKIARMAEIPELPGKPGKLGSFECPLGSLGQTFVGGRRSMRAHARTS